MIQLGRQLQHLTSLELRSIRRQSAPSICPPFELLAAPPHSSASLLSLSHSIHGRPASPAVLFSSTSSSVRITEQQQRSLLPLPSSPAMDTTAPPPTLSPFLYSVRFSRPSPPLFCHRSNQTRPLAVSTPPWPPPFTISTPSPPLAESSPTTTTPALRPAVMTITIISTSLNHHHQQQKLVVAPSLTATITSLGHHSNHHSRPSSFLHLTLLVTRRIIIWRVYRS